MQTREEYCYRVCAASIARFDALIYLGALICGSTNYSTSAST